MTICNNVFSISILFSYNIRIFGKIVRTGEDKSCINDISIRLDTIGRQILIFIGIEIIMIIMMVIVEMVKPRIMMKIIFHVLYLLLLFWLGNAKWKDPVCSDSTYLIYLILNFIINTWLVVDTWAGHLHISMNKSLIWAVVFPDSCICWTQPLIFTQQSSSSVAYL